MLQVKEEQKTTPEQTSLNSSKKSWNHYTQSRDNHIFIAIKAYFNIKQIAEASVKNSPIRSEAEKFLNQILADNEFANDLAEFIDNRNKNYGTLIKHLGQEKMAVLALIAQNTLYDNASTLADEGEDEELITLCNTADEKNSSRIVKKTADMLRQLAEKLEKNLTFSYAQLYKAAAILGDNPAQKVVADIEFAEMNGKTLLLQQFQTSQSPTYKKAPSYVQKPFDSATILLFHYTTACYFHTGTDLIKQDLGKAIDYYWSVITVPQHPDFNEIRTSAAEHFRKLFIALPPKDPLLDKVKQKFASLHPNQAYISVDIPEAGTTGKFHVHSLPKLYQFLLSQRENTPSGPSFSSIITPEKDAKEKPGGAQGIARRWSWDFSAEFTKELERIADEDDAGLQAAIKASLADQKSQTPQSISSASMHLVWNSQGSNPSVSSGSAPAATSSLSSSQQSQSTSASTSTNSNSLSSTSR